ncbi:hypothetical protein H5T51_06190, partial [Candidatus Bathyarchaeota archaeon]|nr:hypothetical protein [Candidatus Bathyarchaeota archaeon]
GFSPLGLTLIYRGINLLTLPLAIILAVGFYKLAAENIKSKTQKTSAFIVTSLIAAIIAVNLYNVYASVSLRERYLGYFWLYKPQEFTAAKWLSAADAKDVAGDVKISYLLTEYFKVKVDPMQGLKYFYGNSDPPPLLVTYDLMKVNGYVSYGGYSLDLPADWMNKTNILNQIYSNSFVKVHKGAYEP